ncbi:hypothetical protein VHEMI01306 [[Torrubiella] hemipterigena]|uniref:Uncharacterized protein n=1 Tax=[Torrubiella] hemipterigena TaxID=1531966 RepID=A0A0A1T4F9_9HYPO|nr:hypothetical protein VHEMI01306 [[Torrubiella] hemipterigena]
MVDVLETTSGVVTVLDLSKTILGYLRNVQHASGDRRQLRQELISLRGILEELKDTVEGVNSDRHKEWSACLSVLNRDDGPLQQLKEALQTLQKILGPSSNDKGSKAAVSSLLFPFQKSSIDKALKAIQRQKSLIVLAIENDHFALSQAILANVKSGIQKWEESQEQQHRQKVISWITPVDYSLNHAAFANQCQENTGQWILDSAEFQSWLQEKKATLFCTGIPGAGKTIITSTIIEHLQQLFHDDTSVVVAYIYCDWKRHHEQRHNDLLSSFVKQLVTKCDSLPPCVSVLYENWESHQKRPMNEDLVATLEAVAALFSRVFWVIDGLDECDLHQCKTFLTDIFAIQNRCRANLLATSRHIPEIIEMFSSGLKLEIRTNEDDIRTYIEGHISELHACVLKHPSLQTDIINGISAAAGGMFLLARFYFNALKYQLTPRGIRDVIRQFQNPPLTDEDKSAALAKLYVDQMERIVAQPPRHRKLAQSTLSWLVCTREPLTTVQLQHALAVEVGDDEFDQDNIPDIQDVLAVCIGLVTFDDETGIIRLAHYTTQEYLEETQTQWLPMSNDYVTSTCCTYLSFKRFRNGVLKVCTKTDSFIALPNDFECRLQENPLYKYAARNWGFHAFNSAENREVLRFLKSVGHVEAASQAFCYDLFKYPHTFPSDTMFAMHLAAHFGLAYAVSALLEDGHLHSLDRNDRTPLSYAAEMGHVNVVSILLESMQQLGVHDTTPDISPLSSAATRGHIDIIKLLLASGEGDLNGTDEDGNSALTFAAMHGHIKLVDLFLDMPMIEVDISREVTTVDEGFCRRHTNCFADFIDESVDGPCDISVHQVEMEESRRTPLSYAAERGHTHVVKRLLASKKVNPNSHNGYGQTPLIYASWRGHDDVVRELLKEDNLEIDLADDGGMTPLSYTATYGREIVFKTLLDTHKANPDSSETNGQTPLSNAARHGFGKIVLWLLETNDVDVNSKCNDYQIGSGCTPLIIAAANGYAHIVDILIKFGASITLQNDKGYCPLLAAIVYGEFEVVQTLVGVVSKTSQTTTWDHLGSTPVSWAAESGNTRILGFLLEHGFSCNSTDRNGRLPLSNSILNRHLDATRLLLDHGAELGHAATEMEMPIQQVPHTSLQIALLLMERGVNINIYDEWGRTIMSNIAARHCFRGEPAGLQWPTVDTPKRQNMPDHYHSTRRLYPQSPFQRIPVPSLPKHYRMGMPMPVSIPSGIDPCDEFRVSLIEILDKTGIGTDLRDIDGRTALSWACEAVNVDMSQTLLDYGADVNSKDNSGRTPLIHAVQNNSQSRHRLAMVLLEYGASVDVIDSKMRTSLSYAAEHGATETVSTLIKYGADPHARDGDHWTPMFFAYKGRHPETVKLLLQNKAEIDIVDRLGRTPLDYGGVILPEDKMMTVTPEDVYIKWRKRRDEEELDNLLMESFAMTAPKYSRESSTEHTGQNEQENIELL